MEPFRPVRAELESPLKEVESIKEITAIEPPGPSESAAASVPESASSIADVELANDNQQPITDNRLIEPISLSPLRTAYLGPESTEEEIHALLDWKKKEISMAECVSTILIVEEELIERTAKAIDDGKVVGWFQGRMEWGPRALGNRSDSRRPPPGRHEGDSEFED